MNELELFTEALNRTDPADRAAFLDRACAGDPDLRRRIGVLLAAQDRSNPLDRPPVAQGGPDETAAPTTAVTIGEKPDRGESTVGTDPDATTADGPASIVARATRAPSGEEIGKVIAGRYTLLGVLGEGGMGTVYRADQTAPVRRQVALKLIRTGMDSRLVQARFDAERQALALMDHPNIARVFDGGTTESGQPFFVMELVRGEPITEHCDRRRLSVRDRLELFVAVCQAVQHAHQKGIIHRDLKPSNVLVAEVDGRPTPKVIDFGVAKATEQKLTDLSLADTGAIVGTPTYMSPEQADPASMDIDTRTDVYALGVILYELLTGSPPIDAKQFQRGAILEMLRMVREVDPTRPSTRLSTAEALPNIAANRNIEPARLAELLHGELDWVVMKALEKDRSRRYDSANGFARDIQRYLADEVVEARPPNRGYRLRKFVRRNRIQVTAASLVFLALVGGIIGTTLGMASARRAQKAEADQRVRADKERDKAIEAQRQTATERDKAIAAEARTKAINEFLTQDLLTQAEPANHAVEDRVTLLEVLDRAAEKVGTRFADQPDLEHALRGTIANTYHGLASWEKAEAQWRVMLNAARKRDPQSVEAYLTQGGLAHILRHRGRWDAEALEMAEEAARGLERTLGPDHTETLRALNNLALAYEDLGKHPEVIGILERVRDVQNTTLGPDHADTLTTLNNLALAYLGAARLPEAIALFERVRDVRVAKLGPDHPDTLTTLGNLADAYRFAGRLPEAIALFERIRDLEISRMGADHPYTLATFRNLAKAYMENGKPAEAIETLEHLRGGPLARLGPNDHETLTTLNDLAATYWKIDRLDKSVPLFEDVLGRQEATLGRSHPDTQLTVANLGVNYMDAGRLKEAIPLLEEAHQAARRFPRLRFVAMELIDAYAKGGEKTKLVDLIREHLSEARRSLPKDSPQLASLLAQISLGLLKQKNWTEAEPLLRECLAIREKTQPDGWAIFNTKSQLGGALLGQKKYADAEPMLLAGYEGMKHRRESIPPQGRARLPEALDRLIELATATNRPDDLKKWQAERAKYAAATPTTAEKK